ncbi:MAG: hypothetical protein WBC04_09110 [Candidatus Acidiferrales bacterium]
MIEYSNRINKATDIGEMFSNEQPRSTGPVKPDMETTGGCLKIAIFAEALPGVRFRVGQG